MFEVGAASACAVKKANVITGYAGKKPPVNMRKPYTPGPLGESVSLDPLIWGVSGTDQHGSVRHPCGSVFRKPGQGAMGRTQSAATLTHARRQRRSMRTRLAQLFGNSRSGFITARFGSASQFDLACNGGSVFRAPRKPAGRGAASSQSLAW